MQAALAKAHLETKTATSYKALIRFVPMDNLRLYLNTPDVILHLIGTPKPL
jgi:hypothetical protein